MVRLTKAQMRHLISRHFFEGIKINQVFEELTDKDAFEKYGFEPAVLSVNYFYTYVKNIPPIDIETARVEWHANILEIPLANKKIRILELVKLFKRASSLTRKQSILRDLKAEAGEDAWQEALKESGAKVSVSFAEKLLGKFEEDNEQAD